MTLTRTLTAAGLLAASIPPAHAAKDMTPTQKAWMHCKAAIEAQRPEAELDMTRYAERGTNTYRFTVNAREGERMERFTCTAHAERGVMKVELLRA